MNVLITRNKRLLKLPTIETLMVVYRKRRNLRHPRLILCTSEYCMEIFIRTNVEGINVNRKLFFFSPFGTITMCFIYVFVATCNGVMNFIKLSLKTNKLAILTVALKLFSIFCEKYLCRVLLRHKRSSRYKLPPLYKPSRV